MNSFLPENRRNVRDLDLMLPVVSLKWVLTNPSKTTNFSPKSMKSLNEFFFFFLMDRDWHTPTALLHRCKWEPGPCALECVRPARCTAVWSLMSRFKSASLEMFYSIRRLLQGPTVIHLSEYRCHSVRGPRFKSPIPTCKEKASQVVEQYFRDLSLLPLQFLSLSKTNKNSCKKAF